MADVAVILNNQAPEALKGASWESISPDWHDHRLENAVGVDTGDGRVWVRKAAKPDTLYKAKPDGSDWRCGKCNTELEGSQVAHTVLDGHFPMSGGGRVEYEVAPYCPKCESPPVFHGRAIPAGRGGVKTTRIRERHRKVPLLTFCDNSPSMPDRLPTSRKVEKDMVSLIGHYHDNIGVNALRQTANNTTDPHQTMGTRGEPNSWTASIHIKDRELALKGAVGVLSNASGFGYVRDFSNTGDKISFVAVMEDGSGQYRFELARKNAGEFWGKMTSLHLDSPVTKTVSCNAAEISDLAASITGIPERMLVRKGPLH